MKDLVVLIVLMAALCSANPTTIISQPDTPSSAGSPIGCRRPNSTYCGVDYSVPDVIATMVHLLEDGIHGQIEVTFSIMAGQELDPCQSATKAILCAQNFPRCEDNNVILTSTQNCTQDIESNCDITLRNMLLDNHFCDLKDEVVPLGTCSALSTFTSQSALSSNHCGQIEGDTLVSEWMFKFIQFTDLKVSKTLATDNGLHIIAPSCSSNHARYFCQFMGECNQESTGVTVKNSYRFCEDTINCYDHSIADVLRPLFPCERWMDLDYPPQPTNPPSQSNPSSNPVGMSTLASAPGVISIDPNPITLTWPGNGAHTLHSTGALLISLTVLLTVLATVL